MSQPAVEGALAEQLVDHQQSGLVSSTAAGTCSPTLGSFTSEAEVCERREAGTAVVAALPPASPCKLEVLDLTSSHNRMPLIDLSVKPKLVNQVPPASSMLPSAVLETSRSTYSNHLEPLSSSGSFHTNRNNNSKCVISVNSSSALGNSTCASSGDDHPRNTLDLTAGLITIDTSSLSSIDATPMTSFQCRSGIQKSNKVTAQGTIIPPLANSIQDSGILQDSSSSVGPVSSHSVYASKSQVCTTTQEQLSRPVDLYDSDFCLESSNSEQEQKNSSKSFHGNTSAKLISTNYSKASSEPSSSVFINGHDQPGNSSSTSLPASASSSPCRVSPASSPSCEVQGVLPTGAGCEVKGMPATPVLAMANQHKDPRESSSVHMDTNDGGRLTFFKEGKLLLELSHRSAGDRASSNKDGKKSGGVWVQIESNTFWPPPSCRANISTPLHFPLPGCGKSASRKQYTPRRCELHGSDFSAAANDAAQRHRDTPYDTFLFFCLPFIRACRRSVVRRVYALARSPHLRSLTMDDIPVNERSRHALLGSQTQRRRFSYLMNSPLDGDKIRRKHRVENCSKILAERSNLNIDFSLKVGQIFERVMLKTPSPNSFVSPRKRYLKQLESDHETQSKKKNLMTTSNCSSRSSSYTPESYQNYPCNKALNARISALNNSGAAHTIDSILNNSEKRNDSYLKCLLKSEGKRSPHSASRSPLAIESVKQEPEALVCIKPDRDPPWGNSERSAGIASWSSSFERRSSRDSEERRPQPAYSSSPHCRSSPPSPRTSRQSHVPPGAAAPSTSAAKNGSAVATEHPYLGPGYAMNHQAITSLYPHLYDPSYFFMNGVNPLAAGGLMTSPHSQMAVAAAAAAAAAASISSMSSYGLAPIQLSALAATQYSNILNSALNPVAFAAAAAASSPLAPNLAAPLTPALTPGAATLPSIPPVNSSTLPSALSPGMSLTSATASHPSFLTASHQARSSPYPTPSPHPRSPYSPTTKSCYPSSRSPHSRPRSPPCKSSVSNYPSASSPYPSRKPSQSLPHHHPQLAQPLSSPWRPVAAHHRPPPTLSSSQDTPLNLTKPRCQ
ncbi:hypothetical protein FHG87_005412 [Trinorchestia longiramus]|nr:hypothetical protein FHG87_005412 [Trinorchestia longiramus]